MESVLLKCLETNALRCWVRNWVEDIRDWWKASLGEFSVSSFQFSVGNGGGFPAAGFGEAADLAGLSPCPSCLGG